MGAREGAWAVGQAAAARGGRALREEDDLLRLDVQVARVPRDEEPVVAQLLVRSQTALLDEVGAADKGRWELEGFWAERVDRLAHAPLELVTRRPRVVAPVEAPDAEADEQHQEGAHARPSEVADEGELLLRALGAL